jgi:uncharacterized protein (TIGR03118 family)
VRLRPSVPVLPILASLALAVAGGGTAAASGVHGAARTAQADGNAFRQVNLVSDLPGRAQVTDKNLVNPWGMAAGPTTPLWVNDNGADVSTLYSGGLNGGPVQINPLVVNIPDGAPTGLVFNPTSDFVVKRGGASGPAAFIFDSEAGTVSAFSPKVPPLTQAVSEFHNDTAVYKGLALADTGSGPRLFATNFHDAKVAVFDRNFQPVSVPGGFTDPNLPAGFAPFGIQQLNGRIYVTYAKQDAARHDDVAGPGNGFVDVYDTQGNLIKRLISRGNLNSPWGLVIAPNGFGKFGGDLLVGNFGDGTIHAYDPQTGEGRGTLLGTDGNPIQNDGLWTLRFGNGVTGDANDLLFSAGIQNEQHGLLGELLATNNGAR